VQVLSVGFDAAWAEVGREGGEQTLIMKLSIPVINCQLAASGGGKKRTGHTPIRVANDVVKYDQLLQLLAEIFHEFRRPAKFVQSVIRVLSSIKVFIDFIVVDVLGTSAKELKWSEKAAPTDAAGMVVSLGWRTPRPGMLAKEHGGVCIALANERRILCGWRRKPW
jgi:biotin synthase-related radical SAM superfamily protein